MFAVPARHGLRVDTHCQAGATVPPYYDSLLGKLIAHAADRGRAIEILLDVLEDLDVDGVDTNRALLISVLGHPEFRDGAVTTGWLEHGWDDRTDRVHRHHHSRRQPEPVERHRADHARRAGHRAASSTGSATTRWISPPRPTWRSACASIARIRGSGIRLVSRGDADTPLGMITTGMRFISWVPADEEVMALSFRLVVRNGLRRLQIADPSNDPGRLRRIAAMAKAEGIEEVVIGLTYSISEVHTHALLRASSPQSWPTAPTWTASTSRTRAGC